MVDVLGSYLSGRQARRTEQMQETQYAGMLEAQNVARAQARKAERMDALTGDFARGLYPDRPDLAEIAGMGAEGVNRAGELAAIQTAQVEARRVAAEERASHLADSVMNMTRQGEYESIQDELFSALEDSGLPAEVLDPHYGKSLEEAQQLITEVRAASEAPAAVSPLGKVYQDILNGIIPSEGADAAITEALDAEGINNIQKVTLADGTNLHVGFQGAEMVAFNPESGKLEPVRDNYDVEQLSDIRQQVQERRELSAVEEREMNQMAAGTNTFLRNIDRAVRTIEFDPASGTFVGDVALFVNNMAVNVGVLAGEYGVSEGQMARDIESFSSSIEQLSGDASVVNSALISAAYAKALILNGTRPTEPDFQNAYKTLTGGTQDPKQLVINLRTAARDMEADFRFRYRESTGEDYAGTFDYSMSDREASTLPAAFLESRSATNAQIGSTYTAPDGAVWEKQEDGTWAKQ